ncbi:acyl-CoA dehydrogenase family protein [Mycobacteroides abscessus]|uniref:acyl-CoA dehydrogenase family protein n=1 Tax=Mycobacteroides abscessus TaxID=36809 RepID=UPI001F3D2A74|nr:acyl-CoA dehydrogenase family protein [Mycobacteroides abscessus]
MKALPPEAALVRLAPSPVDPAEAIIRVSEFCREELQPRREFLDSAPEPPQPYHRVFHERGLTNWWLPREYGGMGMDLASSVDMVSELAYYDAGAAFTFFISIISTTMISLYGTEHQRELTLSGMASGGGFLSTVASEHDAGSELADIATFVRQVGGEIELNGRKMFATNAGFADQLVVIARNADRPHTFHAIIVPRTAPGVVVVQRWNTVGVRSAGTYQVSFDQCRLPASNLLKGPGLELLEIGLNPSRILIAATAVGVARRIRDLCMEYAKTKSLGGQTLARNPVFAAKLGQMEADIEVMRNQCLMAAGEFDAIMAMADSGREFLRRGALRSAMTAKLVCGQTGWRVAGCGSEMFGGLGYTGEHEISKLVRDMRYVAIVEGGEDVLRQMLYTRFVTPPFRRI